MIKHANDLHTINKRKKHESHQIYKTILIDIYAKIKEKNDKNLLNLLYKPPTIVFGNVRYNQKTCMVYVIKKLLESGFIVFPYNSTLVYIDWSCVIDNELKLKSKLKQVTFSADN